MTGTSNDEGGFTTIDLLVASALLMLLVPALVLVLTVTATTFGAVAGKAQAQAAARAILQSVGRDIRSARPLGWCPSGPPGQQFTTPAGACAHIAGYSGQPAGAAVPGGPIAYADHQQLWFWDYTQSRSASPLAVPDCVDVHVTAAGAVLVDRFNGSGTFTTATCPGVAFATDGGPPTTSRPPANRRYVGTLAPGSSHAIFTATDGQGGAPATTTSIVLIRIAPVFSFAAGMATGATATFPVVVDAAVRGAVYEEEQTWDATV